MGAVSAFLSLYLLTLAVLVLLYLRRRHQRCGLPTGPRPAPVDNEVFLVVAISRLGTKRLHWLVIIVMTEVSSIWGIESEG